MNILAGSLLLVVVLSVCTDALEVEERKGDSIIGRKCKKGRDCSKPENYCCKARGPGQQGECAERPLFHQPCSSNSDQKGDIYYKGCPCRQPRDYMCHYYSVNDDLGQCITR
uniref:Ixodegrin B n=1 Tax=Rhipicephalus appendiculatus TaxID=34631 RepID=A0A131YI33_RHIAP